MAKSETILLAEDISMEGSHQRRSRAVKDYAIAFASRLGVSLDIVHIEDINTYPVRNTGNNPIIARFMKSQRERLQRLAHSDKVRIRPLFISGEVVPSLLQLTRKKGQYSCLVLGTHGRKGLSRLLLGSIAEEVLRSAAIPVLVVGAEAQRHVPKMERSLSLLVATDLGPNSHRAEKVALQLAKKLEADVTLFHGLFEGLHPVMQSAYSTPDGRKALADLMAELRLETRRKLELKARRFRAKGVKCNTVLEDLPVKAGEALVRIAGQKKHSFIIMGTHGRNLIAQAFLGSTTRKAILEACIPVMTVNSKK